MTLVYRRLPHFLRGSGPGSDRRGECLQCPSWRRLIRRPFRVDAWLWALSQLPLSARLGDCLTGPALLITSLPFLPSLFLLLRRPLAASDERLPRQVPLLRQGQGAPRQGHRQVARLRLRLLSGPAGGAQGPARDEREVCGESTREAAQVRLEREGLEGGPQEGEEQEEIFEQAGFGVSEEDACCKAKRGSLIQDNATKERHARRPKWSWTLIIPFRSIERPFSVRAYCA